MSPVLGKFKVSGRVGVHIALNPKVLGLNPRCTQHRLETKSCYEVPDNLQVDQDKVLWLTMGEWSCLFISGPKIALGQPSNW